MIAELAKTTALFVATAVAEIVGCYLPWLWLKQGKPGWLLLPAAASLALFAWLLTLHPSATGRTHAAYGGNGDYCAAAHIAPLATRIFRCICMALSFFGKTRIVCGH